MRGPVVGFWDQAGRPAVGVRHLETGDGARGPHHRHGLEPEGLFAKLVDQIAQALPRHHLDQHVGEEVGHAGFDVGRLDVGQRVREGCRG